MSLLKQLMKTYGLDLIIGLDWETYWANDYRLGKKWPTTEYVTSERFKPHMCSIQHHNWTKARVLSPAQVNSWKHGINWARTGVLAHHAHFDGLIASHHFGIKPKFYFDTLSMARALMPIHVSKSLDPLCKALGLQGKVGSDILVDTKGKRDLTRAEYKLMASYAGNDIEQTWLAFFKMAPYLPLEEFDLIDSTVKMYAQPSVLIDEEKMRLVTTNEVDRKDKLFAAAKSLKADLSRNEPFIAKLNALGIETPMKISPKAKKLMASEDYVPTHKDMVPALSKQDQEFKDLLKHPNAKVRMLVEARFAAKSANLEKKSTRLAERSTLGAVPIYLNYSGAKTHRWSGADGVNMQNMDRGSGMRKAIHAPKGHVLIIADQAQIEARFNAWFSGQTDKVEAFRAKKDVYKLGAANIYGKALEAITADERFVGKTAELGLGYQAGGPRLGSMLRIGQFGPPVDISDRLATDIKDAWRRANFAIVQGWKETQNLIRQAFEGKQRVEHKHGIVYEGQGNVGFIHHIPTGMSMRFDGVQVEPNGDLTYISEYRHNFAAPPYIERTKLYGGIEVENRTQFIARMSVAANIRTIKRALSFTRLALTTHDEVLLVCPIRRSDRALRDVVEIMQTPPSWAEGMPFGVDAHISELYDK